MDFVTVERIAAVANLSQPSVREVLLRLRELGRFSSGLGTASDGTMTVISIYLTGDQGYDAYVNFDGCYHAVERFYLEHDPQRIPAFVNISSYFGAEDHDPMGQSFTRPSQKQLKRDTAFVIMSINPNNPELEDVYDAIKTACRAFGIKAVRADEIEHQGSITERIIDEIETCAYIIADLTNERPNVYYEIGYAHAIGKNPILYRKDGTKVHFDLSVHNVPAYKNATMLRENLKRRFEILLGRKSRGEKQ